MVEVKAVTGHLCTHAEGTSQLTFELQCFFTKLGQRNVQG